MKTPKALNIVILTSIIAMTTCCSGRTSTKAASRDNTVETAATTAPRADADTLMSLVAAQVAFGPRVPGSPAHTACHDWIVGRLRDAGATVSLQDTTFAAPGGKVMPVRNIIGRIRPEAGQRVLLCAHYDTRPGADAEDNPALHGTPIDGANDGASGVAVVLEAARLAGSLPDRLGIDIVLFDSEDSGNHEDDLSWCLGSQAWALGCRLTPLPAYGILLDMVGGRDARFGREYFSERYAPAVTDRIRRAAVALRLADIFPDEVTGAVTDDHIHVMSAGIPCADIIELGHPATGSFNPTWHTLDDNLSNISPATLKAVADVTLKAITL